jgi:orotidine-5'-phosphate decarboxylase
LEADGRTVYERVALLVNDLADEHFKTGDYQPIGAVVGATFPEEARMLRAALSRSILLVLGYGAQGATAADVAGCFDESGFGALVNASRSVIFVADSWDDVGPPARTAALRMRDEINEALDQRTV